MSNKKLTGTLIPKDNKKAKMHATFYSDKPVGSGGDSEIFNEHIDATDQQRNTALANVSNQTANSTTGKMGYKVLDPTKTFTEQVTAENTIYEIRDVFDLGGTQETPVSVTLPSDSMLKFNGGIVKNATINLNGAYLSDDVKFLNCDFSGNVSNEYFDPLWLADDIDIGAKINKVGTFQNVIKLKGGSYTFATPIKLQSVKTVDIDAFLTYNGTLVNNDAAIEVLKSIEAYIYIKSLINTVTNTLDFTDTRTINCIGVCITSCNNSNVVVETVKYFNENIRFQDIYGTGCSYNKITTITNFNANVGIRFYMDNQYGTSWCNETIIYGGRFTWQGLSKPHGSLYGVVVAGPYFDNESYRKQGVTSEDASSNIHVIGGSFEGLNYAMYVRNIRGFGMEFIREEAVTNALFKLIGTCLNYYYIPSYSNVFHSIDFTDCTSFSIVHDNYPYKIAVPINYKKDVFPLYQYKNSLCSYDNVKRDSLTSSYMAYSGIVIKTSPGRFYRVRIYNDKEKEITGIGGNILLKYLDSELTILQNQSSYGNKYISSKYSSTFNAYDYAIEIFVPQGVNYLFVGVLLSGLASSVNIIDHITIESTSGIEQIFVDKPLVGTVDERPTTLPLGMQFFNKTSGKFECYNGTAWVNLDGTALS